MKSFDVHPMLTNAHVQTVGAYLMTGAHAHPPAERLRVDLDDGDALLLHGNTPDDWRPGGRVLLLVHGLGGSHASAGLQRLTAKANARGWRVFRMDLRNCGAGLGLALKPYHAGRTDDLRAAVEAIAACAPASPVTLAGFSLGGGMVLRWAGELGAALPPTLDSMVAACPPVDLYASIRALRRTINRPYDWHFATLLRRMVLALRRVRPEAALWTGNTPRTIYEFDDRYIAPVCGFTSARDYYERSSAGPLVPAIRVPTLILTAQDDPLVPFATIQALNRPACVTLEAPPHGGHLGFIARPGADPDRRWMDWRILDWIASQPAGNGHSRAALHSGQSM